MKLDVKGDMKAITRDLRKVERSIVPAATVSALNKTARQVRTASTREISRTKAITPQRLVRDRLQFVRATRRFLVAAIVARLHGIAAAKLGIPRQSATGASVKRHTFPGAFVAVMPSSGHRGIFKRVGKQRLPIREQRVSLQPEASDIVERHVRTTGAVAWVKNFERELAWRLSRKRA